MPPSGTVLAARYFFVDFLGGIAAFPLWWYTRGLALAVAWVGRTVRGASAALGFGVWVKNVFVPMYGEYQWSGRIISFFIRLIMIIVLGIGVAAWSLAALLLFAVYLVALPAAVLGILFHAGGMVV